MNSIQNDLLRLSLTRLMLQKTQTKWREEQIVAREKMTLFNFHKKNVTFIFLYIIKFKNVLDLERNVVTNTKKQIAQYTKHYVVWTGVLIFCPCTKFHVHQKPNI